jgi:hypothetical protein
MHVRGPCTETGSGRKPLILAQEERTKRSLKALRSEFELNDDSRQERRFVDK